MSNPLNGLYDETMVNTPLSKVEDKWKLVPAFLRLRGLTKQHIDSFNYFINVEVKKMVAANSLITVDNPSFREYYVRFTDIRIGEPQVVEDFRQTLTPHECRIRNLTYAAPILVDVE